MTHTIAPAEPTLMARALQALANDLADLDAGAAPAGAKPLGRHLVDTIVGLGLEERLAIHLVLCEYDSAFPSEDLRIERIDRLAAARTRNEVIVTDAVAFLHEETGRLNPTAAPYRVYGDIGPQLDELLARITADELGVAA